MLTRPIFGAPFFPVTPNANLLDGTHQFKEAIVTVFELEEPDFVKVDDSVTRCVVDSWQRRVSVYNTASDTESAADVASTQVGGRGHEVAVRSNIFVNLLTLLALYKLSHTIFKYTKKRDCGLEGVNLSF